MLRGIVYVASAGLVALVALMGHWMVDKPAPAAVASTAAPVNLDRSTSAAPGVPWLPIVLVVIVLFGAVCIYLAWRRRSAIGVPRSAPRPAPQDDPEWPGYLVERWHVIVEAVHGEQRAELRRGPLDWPATSVLTVRREVRRRWIAAFGQPEPGVHIEVFAQPREDAAT